jgi:hypothetical protein
MTMMDDVFRFVEQRVGQAEATLTERLDGVVKRVEPIELAASLIALAADPKASATRLRELRAVLDEVGRAQKQLATDRSNCAAEVAAQRSACAEECAAKRAEVQLSIDALAMREKDLKEHEQRHADRLAEADRIMERFRGYWARKLAEQFGAPAAAMMSIPSFWRPDPTEAEPDAHMRRVDEGSFDASAAALETVPADMHDLPLPAGVSLTRTMRRGAEA